MSRIATRLTRLESALNPDDVEAEVSYRLFWNWEEIPPEYADRPPIQLQWADEIGLPEIPDSSDATIQGLPE